MQKIHLTDGNTELSFVTMFEKRNLVPILGAGFSKGAPTRLARVPDAEEFRMTMLEILRTHVGDETESIKEKNFSEVADHFLNPSFVPTATVKETIKKYFTEASLGATQKGFLNCPWPYIYTLNIDDAIENNSSFRNKVIPNRQISSSAKQLPCVYKVHGDAADELIYDEPSKIIFSTAQYVRSLTTNQSILNALKTDLTEQNTLFVGCRLDQELDLLYALAEYHGAFPKGRLSIFVTRQKPNKFEEAKLLSHGVNTILLVDNYTAFYESVTLWGKQAQKRTTSLISAYIVGTDKHELSADRATNLSFLLKDPRLAQSGNYSAIPHYLIKRDLQDKILHVGERAPISLIRGRRFSGKTLLLRSLSLSARARKVYFWESNSEISNEELDELISVKNGLFIFDTNVLTPISANYLAGQFDKLKSNNSSAVVAVNRTEPYVVGALVKYVDDDADFELSSRLISRECVELNSKLDALGIFRFDCKKTLLDNTFTLLERSPHVKSELVKNHDLNEKEVEVLLVAAIVDKAYSSLATALNLRTEELFALGTKLAPIVEIVETSKTELSDTNSRYKLVTNSKIGLSLQIRNLVVAKGHRWLSERIAATVKRLIILPKFQSVGHSMYMFDAINYLLAQPSQPDEATGYRPVVLSLYENLQPILNQSPDYWLQRAKAVHNLEKTEPLLLNGVDYALKSYHEAERLRTSDNAEFTIALLYGKLCVVTDFNQSKYIKASIQWFSRAIRNYSRNMQYVKTMIEGRNRRNSFHQLCDFLEGSIIEASMLPLREDIQFLIEVRRGWHFD
jgi:SIR2-like protein